MSLCPFVFHLAGPIYLAGAVVLSAGYLWCAIQFARQLTLAQARQLFFASILYLPLLLRLLVLDKGKPAQQFSLGQFRSAPGEGTRPTSATKPPSCGPGALTRRVGLVQ